jgi:hypothetical protein
MGKGKYNSFFQRAQVQVYIGKKVIKVYIG